jgi:transposase
MHGVGCSVAVTLVAELGDVERFDNPRQLMAYLGLTPSEHSSGASVRRGGITKAGSSLARPALIDGAWSYRMQARVSPKFQARLGALPQAVLDIAWKGQLRMRQRYRHLVAAEKAKVVFITAIAREMTCSIWGIARPTTPARASRRHGKRQLTHPDAQGLGRPSLDACSTYSHSGNKRGSQPAKT